jgi:integral membrane protein
VTSKIAFRWVAIAEATSWLILIVATIVKYAADAPVGVKIMGPIHGVLFVGYVLLALTLRSQFAWNGRTSLIVLVDSIIPTGGFFVARRDDLRTAGRATTAAR